MFYYPTTQKIEKTAHRQNQAQEHILNLQEKAMNGYILNNQQLCLKYEDRLMKKQLAYTVAGSTKPHL